MSESEPLDRYLRHGATCNLQAVRDNPPDDPDCNCGLREAFAARDRPGLDVKLAVKYAAELRRSTERTAISSEDWRFLNGYEKALRDLGIAQQREGAGE